ncbi:WhiB family transcriptional regulator [Mycobacterium sp. 1245801.1]|uniref:WhiB family transcriptional regulator n=1 Tax=Mycobacterium sp. 1245801.1 TaxID=1834075 RepID=UPI0009F3FD0A|nr:WhiB family transcriptional regulator [Mycobacterium sp. 1245801.1]
MAHRRLVRGAAPPAKTLPCQRDPERWFNRRHRRDTLAACLNCPARPWCAQQALTWHACWGMWAGVWIDGQHTDAAPYLHAIAADHPLPHPPRTLLPAKGFRSGPGCAGGG